MVRTERILIWEDNQKSLGIANTEKTTINYRLSSEWEANEMQAPCLTAFKPVDSEVLDKLCFLTARDYITNNWRSALYDVVLKITTPRGSTHEIFDEIVVTPDGILDRNYVDNLAPLNRITAEIEYHSNESGELTIELKYLEEEHLNNMIKFDVNEIIIEAEAVLNYVTY